MNSFISTHIKVLKVDRFPKKRKRLHGRPPKKKKENAFVVRDKAPSFSEALDFSLPSLPLYPALHAFI